MSYLRNLKGCLSIYCKNQFYCYIYNHTLIKKKLISLVWTTLDTGKDGAWMLLLNHEANTQFQLLMGGGKKRILYIFQ